MSPWMVIMPLPAPMNECAAFVRLLLTGANRANEHNGFSALIDHGAF